MRYKKKKIGLKKYISINNLNLVSTTYDAFYGFFITNLYFFFNPNVKSQGVKSLRTLKNHFFFLITQMTRHIRQHIRFWRRRFKGDQYKRKIETFKFYFKIVVTSLIDFPVSIQ